jgi:hypothetical protein
VDRSGRTMARTGLRMMPTFPLSPLRFRTAGFPQYGSKAGISDRAFPKSRTVKPAPSIPVTRPRFASVLCASHPQRFCRRSAPSASCVAKHHHASDFCHSTPGALAPVRVIVSRSINTYPAPSAPLVGTSQLRRPAAYMRCLRCAGAPRRLTSGSGLLLRILCWHAALYDHGGFDFAKFQIDDVDTAFVESRSTRQPPRPPQSVSRGAMNFAASWFAYLLRPTSLLALLHGSDWITPAIEGFYIQASGRSVTLPTAGHDYNSDWTPLLTGHAPARMATSLAAPTPSSQWTFTTISSPVYPAHHQRIRSRGASPAKMEIRASRS